MIKPDLQLEASFAKQIAKESNEFESKILSIETRPGSFAGQSDQSYITIPDRRRHKEERRKEDQSEPDSSSPHSLEAEQSLIGALLLDNSRLAGVLQIADESHIYRDDHRRIFQHIVRIIESGERADVVTVFESIERQNEVEQTGGLAYLGEIVDSTPSAANILSYAKVVRERFIMRKLAECGERITALAMMPGGMRLAEQMQAAQEAWRAVSGEYRSYAEKREKRLISIPK